MSILLNPYVFAAGGGGGGPIGVLGTGTATVVANGFATVAHTLPAYSAGDYVFIQCNYPTSGGTAGVSLPAGWLTLIDGSHGAPGGTTDKYYLFYKKMNGSEGSTVTITQTGSAGAGNRFQCQSFAVQGVKQSGTFYESLFHYQNRHYSRGAIGYSLQAHGGNRVALHFYFGGPSSANAIAPAVDDFTDIYSLHDSAGTTNAIACSYRNIAASELTTLEQRTGNNASWAVASLVLIQEGETAGTPLARRDWYVQGLWQFSGADNQTMAAQEIEMRLSPGGADITAAAYAVASSEFSGSFADDFAFNNNPADLWSSIIGTWYNHRIGQNFSAIGDQLVAEVVYTAAGGGGAAASPKDGLILATPDGVRFEGRKFFADLSWSAGSSNTISIP